VTAGPSLQERYAPEGRCFGCGPANGSGLHVGSHLADDGDGLVAEWQPGPDHLAFDEILAGGIIGTLMDCHSNWTAAMALMAMRGVSHPPACVTAEFAVRLRRPTPMSEPVRLRARVAELREDRAVIDCELVAGGEVTATCRGTFVAVPPGHPAFGRW
jgi:acyl-coenzyme A thioesterase PaaI-like protein